MGWILIIKDYGYHIVLFSSLILILDQLYCRYFSHPFCSVLFARDLTALRVKAAEKTTHSKESDMHEYTERIMHWIYRRINCFLCYKIIIFNYLKVSAALAAVLMAMTHVVFHLPAGMAGIAFYEARSNPQHFGEYVELLWQLYLLAMGVTAFGSLADFFIYLYAFRGFRKSVYHLVVRCRNCSASNESPTGDKWSKYSRSVDGRIEKQPAAHRTR